MFILKWCNSSSQNTSFEIFIHSYLYIANMIGWKNILLENDIAKMSRCYQSRWYFSKDWKFPQNNSKLIPNLEVYIILIYLSILLFNLINTIYLLFLIKTCNSLFNRTMFRGDKRRNIRTCGLDYIENGSLKLLSHIKKI